jgi:hypothetical protein
MGDWKIETNRQKIEQFGVLLTGNIGANIADQPL